MGAGPLPGRPEGANFAPGIAAMMVVAVAAASPRSMIFENGAVERKRLSPIYLIDLIEYFLAHTERSVVVSVVVRAISNSGIRRRTTLHGLP